MPLTFLDAVDKNAPHLTALTPDAAIPGGVVEVSGSGLAPLGGAAGMLHLPTARVGDVEAMVTLSRTDRALVRVPSGAIAADLTLAHGVHRSNSLQLRVGVPFAEELHLVSNPAIDAEGNLFAMVSGPRGETVPVAIYRITLDLETRPFVRDLLNVSSLAFDHAGYLYASSRAEGAVYRISPDGAIITYAEGMGIATGLAFDAAGDLFVGDRSGTIFKVAANPESPHTPRDVFVFATLEPSVAAYHLAFTEDGTLLVTAPGTSSNDAIWAIGPEGATRVFYRGLGRPQGLAVDADDNVYVAASLGGHRGIVRVTADGGEAKLIVNGNDLVGLCFLDDGCAALATANTLYHIDLGIEGRRLI
jgi:hypothetical protein